MHEVNADNQPKRRRVLRARDVIPPFDRSVPPAAEEPRVEPPSPQAAPAPNPLSASPRPVRMNDRPEDKTDSLTAVPPGETAQVRLSDIAEVPTYDLAENILAEQRRAAGRRRRAPGRAQEKSVAPPQGAGIRLFFPEPTSQELLELQRVVAEIVARDIERLCKRPDRPPIAVSA